MRYRILGQLAVMVANATLPPGGAREQRALAMLLLNAGNTVSAQRLVDAVWGEEPPSAADKQLRNVVYRLRRLLASASDPEAITSAAGGYRIQVAEGELDAAVFEAAVAVAQREAADGHVKQAAQTLTGALRLWRGPALDGLGGLEIETAATAWNLRRLAAQSTLAGHLLALDRPQLAVAELTEPVSRHPLREDLVGLLMTALYRCGRQAEALALYDATRARLTREVGIDPCAVLRELHHRILTSSPDLTVSALDTSTRPESRRGGESAGARPFQLPPAVRGFVGRRIEYDRLTALAASAASETGASAVALLTGLAGVGKSTLAMLWARRNASLYPDGILVADLHGFDPAGEPADPATTLESFLRALGVAAEAIPQAVEERSALLRTCLAGRRVLMVLDNVARAEQVRPLLTGSPGCLSLVTSRDALSGLVVRDGATRVVVESLSRDDSLTLLTEALGSGRLAAEPEAVEHVLRGCAGLPLALRIAAEQLVRQPRAQLSALADRLVSEPSVLDFLSIDGDHPSSVRTVFSWSYEALPAEHARVLRLIALLAGADICVPAVAALSGTTLSDASSALSALANVHLLSSSESGRYGIHDLVRAFAADLARTVDPAGVHGEAAGRLAAWYAQTAAAADRLLMPQRPNVELADPPPGSGEPLRLAGHDEAMAWCEAERGNFPAVLGNALRYGHPDPAWRVTCLLSGFHMQAKYWSEWEDLCRIGLECARAAGDRAGEARIINHLGVLCGQRRRHREAVEHFTRAAHLRKELGDRNGEAGALANVSVVEHLLGNYEQALAVSAAVRDIHREHGSTYEEAITLTNMGAACIELDRHDEALEYLKTSVDMLRGLENNYALGMTLDTYGKLLQAMGCSTEALQHHREALAIFRGTGDEYNQAGTLHLIGTALLKAGEAVQAERALTASLALFDRIGAADAPEAVEARELLTSS